MSMIKQAQSLFEQINIVAEAVLEHNIPLQLLESLDGVVHSYIQRINGGQMANFNYEDISALANIFALASMIGATDSTGLDTNAANQILNLYKSAKPGDAGSVGEDIERTVNELDPTMQAKFRNLANAWGKSLSQTIQNPTPVAMKSVSNRLLKAVTLMTSAIDKIEAGHGDNIAKSAIQSNNWRQQGVLNRR